MLPLPKISEACTVFEDEDYQEFAVRTHEHRIDKDHAGIRPASIDHLSLSLGCASFPFIGGDIRLCFPEPFDPAPQVAFDCCYTSPPSSPSVASTSSPESSSEELDLFDRFVDTQKCEGVEYYDPDQLSIFSCDDKGSIGDLDWPVVNSQRLTSALVHSTTQFPPPRSVHRPRSLSLLDSQERGEVHMAHHLSLAHHIVANNHSIGNLPVAREDFMATGVLRPTWETRWNGTNALFHRDSSMRTGVERDNLECPSSPASPDGVDPRAIEGTPSGDEHSSFEESEDETSTTQGFDNSYHDLTAYQGRLELTTRRPSRVSSPYGYGHRALSPYPQPHRTQSPERGEARASSVGPSRTQRTAATQQLLTAKELAGARTKHRKHHSLNLPTSFASPYAPNHDFPGVIAAAPNTRRSQIIRPRHTSQPTNSKLPGTEAPLQPHEASPTRAAIKVPAPGEGATVVDGVNPVGSSELDSDDEFQVKKPPSSHSQHVPGRKGARIQPSGGHPAAKPKARVSKPAVLPRKKHEEYRVGEWRPVGTSGMREAAAARRVGKEVEYPCKYAPLCPAKFTSKQNLLSHYWKHLGIQPYGCACGYSTSYKWDRSRHLRANKPSCRELPVDSQYLEELKAAESADKKDKKSGSKKS
ncbi:hypothetical protein BKA70DRAFT_726006 [Coprinopsis sp. MPI-PUGE-AT-0042]|nr:hypothetical protein BKA70DRAFT_726006 [Coprinopsis sp. MPI-PUGE-AT-0042]